jgi:hypothetical protein
MKEIRFNDRLWFGKYKNQRINDLIKNDPSYVQKILNEESSNIKLDPKTMQFFMERTGQSDRKRMPDGLRFTHRIVQQQITGQIQNDDDVQIDLARELERELVRGQEIEQQLSMSIPRVNPDPEPVPDPEPTLDSGPVTNLNSDTNSYSYTPYVRAFENHIDQTLTSTQSPSSRDDGRIYSDNYRTYIKSVNVDPFLTELRNRRHATKSLDGISQNTSSPENEQNSNDDTIANIESYMKQYLNSKSQMFKTFEF